MSGNYFQINKASGEKERFSRLKLTASLLRAGFTKNPAQNIAKKVSGGISSHSSSNDGNQRTIRETKLVDPILAMRYQLKRAIMELGPAGYAFEDYVGRILSRYGYQTQVGAMALGRCVRHEVDVLAEKDGRHIMIECKYHNQLGVKSDLHVALYTQARFLDLRAAWEQNKNDQHEIHEGWLVTNTKVTSEAAQYAHCVGLRVISWNYPQQKNLQEIIEQKALYPVTILSGLSRQQKRILLDNNIVIVHDVADDDKMRRILKLARIAAPQRKNLRQQILALSSSCGYTEFNNFAAVGAKNILSKTKQYGRK